MKAFFIQWHLFQDVCLCYCIIRVLCYLLTLSQYVFFLLGGFAFLPFLWLVNVVWFFQDAFVKPAYTEQVQIKTCECLLMHVITKIYKYVLVAMHVIPDHFLYRLLCWHLISFGI